MYKNWVNNEAAGARPPSRAQLNVREGDPQGELRVTKDGTGGIYRPEHSTTPKKKNNERSTNHDEQTERERHPSCVKSRHNNSPPSF